MRSLFSPLLVCVIVGSAPLVCAASAQEATGATVAVSRVSLLADVSVSRTRFEIGRTSPSLPVAAEQKDPLVAGVLSALVPGLGSFYADNSRHGAIHLGIDVAAYALMFGAIGSASTCATYSCVNSTASTVYVGYAGYMINEAWSIFTAVSDAHAYNGNTDSKPGRVVGNLYIDPVLQHLGTEPTPRGAVDHTGLQLARLSF